MTIYPKLSKKCYWEFSPDNSPYGWYYYISTKKFQYHITAECVTLETDENAKTFDNICPMNLYKDCEKGLSEDQIIEIITLTQKSSIQFNESIIKDHKSVIKYCEDKKRAALNKLNTLLMLPLVKIGQ